MNVALKSKGALLTAVVWFCMFFLKLWDSFNTTGEFCIDNINWRGNDYYCIGSSPIWFSIYIFTWVLVFVVLIMMSFGPKK